jgi:hypothetical protein
MHILNIYIMHTMVNQQANSAISYSMWRNKLADDNKVILLLVSFRYCVSWHRLSTQLFIGVNKRTIFALANKN